MEADLIEPGTPVLHDAKTRKMLRAVGLPETTFLVVSPAVNRARRHIWNPQRQQTWCHNVLMPQTFMAGKKDSQLPICARCLASLPAVAARLAKKAREGKLL